MMHPKATSDSGVKRGHSCSHSVDSNDSYSTGSSQQQQQLGCSSCGTSASKRHHHASNGVEVAEESLSLADSLFSLVTVAEQQRQAQERGGAASSDYHSHHVYPLSCSAPAVISRQSAHHHQAERLITFTTARREYPHLRPVPLKELSSLKFFRTWVRRSFELKEDSNFILVDRSVEAMNDGDSGIIDSDVKLGNAKDVEIVEVQDDADRTEREQDLNGLSPTANSQSHQDLLVYAKSIMVFLSEKGNAEARSIVATSPSAFASCPPLSSLPSDSHPYIPLNSISGALLSVPSNVTTPPVLPRIVAQAPPCLIPGYYIFSPVFDSFGEKRKLPIKIEIPRALVFNGERYKTVSTYIGLGPFGNDPNSFVKLEGDHLVGTIASRLEDDEEGGNGSNGTICTYVFKNLRLKTRSLIRTVLDVSYNGMRTGRFFFMVDNDVLPNTSRRFEIKAPSGYTIKMVNKTARSNPVAKHVQQSPPTSQPSSPTTPFSRPSSPTESPRYHHNLSQSQPLPLVHSISLPHRPNTPTAHHQPLSPTSLSSPISTTSSASHHHSSFHQLQIPQSVLMQLNKQKKVDAPVLPATPPNQYPQQQLQTPQQLYQQLQPFLVYSPPTKSQKHNKTHSSSSGTSSPPTIPKGYTSTTLLQSPLAPRHTQLHTQTQQQSTAANANVNTITAETETETHPQFQAIVGHADSSAGVMLVRRPVIA